MYAQTRYGGITRFGAAGLIDDCCARTGSSDCCQAAARSRYSGVTSYSTSLRGDDTSSPPSLHDKLTSPAIKTVAAVAMTYHGYKRTGSIVWALLYGLAGRTVPLVAVPVAVGQGFGKKKEGC